MPQKSKFKLRKLDLGSETLGERIRRLRKKNGLTQKELAKEIGIVQALISDYERGRLKPHVEMLVRFALALGVSTDELVGLKKAKVEIQAPSLKIVKRLKKIEALPEGPQKFILRTIDACLKGIEAEK